MMPGEYGVEQAPAAEARRLDQFKIIYDYVKFHIGLYLSTPAVMALVGNALSISNHRAFKSSLLISILVFLVSGLHAGWFMGRYINSPGTPDFPSGHMWDYLFTFRRRLFHHVFIGLE
jgi:hypothetical protein